MPPCRHGPKPQADGKMPSFAISQFIILLEPLWVPADFLLLSTGPNLDGTKISRGEFPRPIFSCPVPSGLPHRSHCVPMNMNPSGYGLHLPLTGSFPWVIPPFAVMITKTCVEMMTPFIIPHSSVFWTMYVPPNFLSRRLDKHDIMKITDVNES